MDKILEYSQLQIGSVHETFKRTLYDEIETDKNRIIGVVGMRGIGKTTLLLQIAKTRKNSVYFSMDAVFLVGEKIFDLVEDLYKNYGIKNFFIDEIHKYENWEQDLKTIYDFLPDVRVMFSGSSSINLIKGNHDLSRRGKLYNLYKFSFSEYLRFHHNITINSYSLSDILKKSSALSYELIQKYPHMGELFHEYLKKGELGFSSESTLSDYNGKLENIVHKMIYEDISSFYSLKTENISYFLEILKFIANASPSQINYTNIATTLETTPNTVKTYIEILIEIGFLHAMGKSGKISVHLRKTKKVYFEMQNFMSVFSNSLNQDNYIGTLREGFVASLLSKKGSIYYPPKGDIEFHTYGVIYTFEVGGKNKTRKQIQKLENSYVIADDINIGIPGIIPIWLFGLIRD